MAEGDLPPPKQRSLRVLAWATLPVTLLGAWVQVTGEGIDLFVIAIAAILLLGMERTLGDWLGELLGSVLAALVFSIFIAGLVLYFVADADGKSRAREFFQSAEARGYKTVYFYTPPPDDPDARAYPVQATAVTPAAARVTGGEVLRSSSRPEGTTGDQVQVAPPISEDPGVADSGAPPGKRRTRFFWSTSDQRVATETSTSFSISPGKVAPGQRVTLRAMVTSGGVAVTAGYVDFTVNGIGAGRVPLSVAGTSTTAYSTFISGTYEIQARYSGTEVFAASLSRPVILNVTSPR